MKRYTILLILILLVLLGSVFYTITAPATNAKALTSKPLKETQPNNSSFRSETNSIPFPKESHLPILQDKANRMQQSYNLYSPISIEEAKLTYPPRKDIEPVGAIELNKMQNLQEGDTLTFDNIEGVDYTIVISNLQTNADGSRTTTGNYQDEGISYTTTMTLSQNTAYITITSPQGIYEIETKNGVGYIYRTDTMRKQLQDFDKDDFIILPVPKAPNSLE